MTKFILFMFIACTTQFAFAIGKPKPVSQGPTNPPSIGLGQMHQSQKAVRDLLANLNLQASDYFDRFDGPTWEFVLSKVVNVQQPWVQQLNAHFESAEFLTADVVTQNGERMGAKFLVRKVVEDYGLLSPTIFRATADLELRPSLSRCEGLFTAHAN